MLLGSSISLKDGKWLIARLCYLACPYEVSGQQPLGKKYLNVYPVKFQDFQT